MNNNPFKNISLFTRDEAEEMRNSKELESLKDTFFDLDNNDQETFVWLKLVHYGGAPARQYVIELEKERVFTNSYFYIMPRPMDKYGEALFKIDFDDVKNSPYLKKVDGSTDKYTLGEFPQTEVKSNKLIDELYKKLHDKTLIKTGKKYSFNGDNRPISMNYEYQSSKDYEYQLGNNKYVLYGGKWYKVEPIIWKYSRSTNSLYNLKPIISTLNSYDLNSSLREGLIASNFMPSMLIIKDKVVNFSEIKEKLNNNSKYKNLNLIIDVDITSSDIREFYKEYGPYIKNLNVIGASNSIKALFFLLQTYEISVTFDKEYNSKNMETKKEESNKQIKKEEDKNISDINQLLEAIKDIADKLETKDRDKILNKVESIVKEYNTKIENIKNSVIVINNSITLSTSPQDSNTLKGNLIVDLNNILNLLNRKLLLNPLLNELLDIQMGNYYENSEVSKLSFNIKTFIDSLDTANKNLRSNDLFNIIRKYYNEISKEINLDINTDIKLTLNNKDYKNDLINELNEYYNNLKNDKKLSILSGLSNFSNILDGDTKTSNTLYIDNGYLNVIELTLIDIYDISQKLESNIRIEKIKQISNICNKYLVLISNENNIEEIKKLEEELFSILTKELLLLKLYFIKEKDNIENDIIDTSVIRR